MLGTGACEGVSELSQQDWIEVAVDCHKGAVDGLEAWLFEAGALSVTSRDSITDEQLEHAVLEPAPGEVRLWNEVTLTGLFAQGADVEHVRDALAIAATTSGLAQPLYRLDRLQDQVWERTWMDSFKPMRFGHRLWICPTETEPMDQDAVTLWLDPGMAFGTGTHATTAQCLTWMGEQTQHDLTPLRGKSVIDFGCGSGVLSIAALLLGAEHAWAVDIDEQALLASSDNALTNSVAARLSVGQPSILDGVTADILLANILFQPLMELADVFAERVVAGGYLVMSGILESQMKPLRMRYNDAFDFAAGGASDGWALMIATRR